MKTDIINQNLLQQQMETVGEKTRSSKKETERKETELKKTELMEAAQGFEAIFIHTVLKSMRETLPGDALFEKSHAMGIFESMQDQHLAEELSKSRNGFGIGKFLYEELKKTTS
ncbi:MAG: rod-binding protein [Desulfotignum sp.]